VSEKVLLVEKSEGIATVTMNRPRVMNALSGELRESLRQAFIDLSGDPETEVVILTGAGRAFCGGLDLKELSTKGIGIEDPGAIPTGGSFFINATEFERPIIGAINGAAVTGGLELALICDVLIASTEAVFADTHARVGILPGWGLSQILPRILGPGRAKEISFTGNFISAEQAQTWGLVNRVVSPEALLPTAHALAKDIQSCLPEAVAAYKGLINRGLAMNLEDALKMEAKASVASARRATSEELADRREKIIRRGRGQIESPGK